MPLLTLTEAKNYLKVDYTDEDTLIQSLIDEATSTLQRKYGRDLFENTYTDEEYDGEGHEMLFIRNFPVQSVTSLTIGDDTIDASDYSLSKNTGILKYNGRIPEGFANVKISYTGGYASGDSRLDHFKKEARLLVGQLYEGRGATI
jgi:uncharacterized phiE125 gp8 family phage protein